MSPGAGVLLAVKPGDSVRAGDPIMTLLTDEASRIPLALEALDGAVRVDGEGTPVHRLPLVVDRVDEQSH